MHARAVRCCCHRSRAADGNTRRQEADRAREKAVVAVINGRNKLTEVHRRGRGELLYPCSD